MRIGIHTGPVVAGVIGRRKFAYDLWGDAVNTAARMESHGVPGAIHVTRTVHEALADRCRFEARGTVDVKGKGPMETWLLLGWRDAGAAEGAPPAAAGGEPPAAAGGEPA
jgi:guanylate cyclase